MADVGSDGRVESTGMAEEDPVEAMRKRLADDLDLQRNVRLMHDALARGRDPGGRRRSLAELRRILDESL